MAIIFEPAPKFIDLREALGRGTEQAAILAALDFVSGVNKAWSYYVGVAAGATAVATGIPGAAATLYIIGDSIDGYLLKSPDGSNVRLFLNGVAVTTIDTYAATAAWEVFQVILDNGLNRLDIVNEGVSPQNAGLIPWMALRSFTVNGANASVYEKEVLAMPTLISIQITEAGDAPDTDSVIINIPDGLTVAEYTAFAQEAATLVDAVTDGAVTGLRVELGIALPGGLGAADPDSDNQHGANFSFTTATGRTFSYRVPAILPSGFVGNSVPRGTGDAVDDLILFLQDGFDAGAGVVQPITPDGIAIGAFKGSKKSQRKK